MGILHLAVGHGKHRGGDEVKWADMRRTTEQQTLTDSAKRRRTRQRASKGERKKSWKRGKDGKSNSVGRKSNSGKIKRGRGGRTGRAWGFFFYYHPPGTPAVSGHLVELVTVLEGGTAASAPEHSCSYLSRPPQGNHGNGHHTSSGAAERTDAPDLKV